MPRPPNRNGRGRPPKPAGEAATRKLMIRLSEEDYQAIAAAARADGSYAISTWIRSAALRMVRDRDRAERKGGR